MKPFEPIGPLNLSNAPLSAGEAAKRAGEALRQSEEHFRSLVQNASDIIAVLEADGTIRYVSPAVERVLGYRPEELIGKKAFGYVYPDDVDDAADTLSQIVSKAGVQPSYESRVPHKDGSQRYLETAVNNLLEHPKVGAIVLTSRDVTERKQAEERIQFQSRLLDAVGQAVIATDLRGRITYWNRSAEELYGWSAQEVMGRSVMEVTPSKEQLERADEIMTELRAGRNWSGEFVVQRRDGTTFPAIVTNTPVYDERGNLVGIIGVSTDITERKQVEYNQQRFLANAAHQLRTPTTALVGAAELLATREDANPATRERLLNHILTEGNRLGRLADSLLHMVRIGQDLRKLHLEMVDLSRALKRAAEVMEPIAESAGITLEVEGEGGRVRADSEWLQEALQIVLSNAIKHSSRGAITRLRANGETITVEDEGAGINSEDLPHVFERFYRGKGSSEGFGLGLSICQGLIERMGGSISISSREGVGTSVKIRLRGYTPNHPPETTEGVTRKSKMP